MIPKFAKLGKKISILQLFFFQIKFDLCRLTVLGAKLHLMPGKIMSHIMRKSVHALCNNKGADQPAHLQSDQRLVPFLDSRIFILDKS